MYIKKIKIPIYSAILKIIITDDPEYKDVNKKFKTRANANYDAFTFTDIENGDFCIVVAPDTTNSTVCHECVHLTNYVFKYYGVKLDLKNDESQAYLTGWFFDNIESTMKKYNRDNQKDDTK